MSCHGDSAPEPKRQRLNHQKRHRQQRFSRKAKGKSIIEEKPVLSVNIICAVDIDCDLRSVTHNRYYGVQGWINPGQEYHTRVCRPDVCNYNLDPVWKEQFLMPLGETGVEDATLHLDVLRLADTVLDPSNSARTKLVGMVRFRLDQLQANECVTIGFQLMQQGNFGWKPEGHICLEMELLMIPFPI